MGVSGPSTSRQASYTAWPERVARPAAGRSAEPCHSQPRANWSSVSDAASWRAYARRAFLRALSPPSPKASSPIGSASDGNRWTDILTRLRNLPDEDFEKSREKIRQRHTDKLHNLCYPGFDYEAETDRFIEIIEETRKLSDLDFALKVDELVEKIKPDDTFCPEPRHTSLGTLRHLLADPVFKKVIEERLSQELTENH